MKLKRIIVFILCILSISSITLLHSEKEEIYPEQFSQIFKTEPSPSEITNEVQNIVINEIEQAITPTITETKTTSAQKFNSNFEYNGWIPGFDFNNGYNSILKNKSRFKSIHYAAASLNTDGKLSFSANFETNFQKLNTLGISYGLNIHSGNTNSFKNLYSNEQNKQEFINKITGLKASSTNFNSINLNLEKLAVDDKDNFVGFLRELKESMKEKKILIYVTFFGNDSDINNPYDYSGIGESADYVVLMAYDYILRTNKKPGTEKANAPDFWIEGILEYAENKIPQEKLILGLPLYGYGFNKSTGKMTTSYTYSQIKNIMTSTPLLEEDTNEMYIERANEIIYFQTRETLNKKMQIAQRYRINKIFFWRLGGEGELAD